MRKILCLALCAILIVGLVTCMIGCNKSAVQEINVCVPDGAPALAIAKLLAGKEFDGYKVKYEIVDGTDIAAKLTSGQADLAILPTNLAAKLYNNNVKIKMLAANVYGLLYLVGNADISSFSELRGEKILCTGQGGTPDFVLRYLLSVNGVSVEDVTIEYISQASDAIAQLNAGTAKFALLGEPAATMAVSKANSKVIFDMQEEWEKTTGVYGYPQACTVVSDELFSTKAAFLKLFLKEMNENLTWMSQNIDEVNAAIKSYGGKTSFASSNVISRCNIKYVEARSAKEDVETYLSVMASFNSAFIGGKLPDQGFYAHVPLE